MLNRTVTKSALNFLQFFLQVSKVFKLICDSNRLEGVKLFFDTVCFILIPVHHLLWKPFIFS